MSRFRGMLTWESRTKGARVLYVTNMYPDDERPVYGVFVKRQIESMSRAGVDSDVLYVRGYKGAHVYVWACLYFLVSTLRWRKRYALVHAHAGETAFVSRFLIGVPMVASYCGDDVLGHAHADGTISRPHRLRRRVLKEQSRLLTATITKSPEMAAVLPLPGKNTVIPNGIDTKTFAPIDRDVARDRLGWKSRGPVVLFAATRPYEERKRLPLAQAAIKVAAAELGPIELFIAENVAPATVPLLMNAADCLLLTSQSEGSPNAVKEAIMCNLPVVSTDVGDVAELVAGVSFSSVEADTPEALGAAVAAVLRAGGRSNGREVKAELADFVVAQRLLSVYREAGAASVVASATPS